MNERRKISNREIITNLFFWATKSIMLILVIGCIVFQLSERDLRAIRVIPPKDKVAEIKEDLKQLTPNLPNAYLEDVSKSIKVASEVTSINDKLITSVAYYESKMNHNAQSNKGYKGIMQATTHDIYEFAEVDIMRGAKKMQNWIKYRNGDLRYALASYNGGTYPPPSSYLYADKVIQLSRKLTNSRRM